VPSAPGGELVSHASLAGAAAYPVGYRLFSEGREVCNLVGAPIPIGPIDDAAVLITGEDDPTILTVMIEVKNLRSWLYPSADEIQQLFV
jgi:hypothetical protein